MLAKILALVASGAIGCWGLMYPLVSRGADCHLSKVAEISVSERSKFLVFDVTIDGHPIKAAFGSGERIAEISPELMPALALERGSSQPPFSKGSAKILKMQIGNLTFGEIEAEPLSDETALPSGVQLSLGPQVFGNLDMEIDLSRNRLALFKSDHCPDQVVYWAKEWFAMPYQLLGDATPGVQVEVNGHLMDAGLHLATAFTNITPAKAWGVQAEESHGGYVLDRLAFDGVALRHVTAGSLRVSIKENTGEISHTDAKTWHLPDLMIGRNELKNLHLFVSRNDKKVFFTLASDG